MCRSRACPCPDLHMTKHRITMPKSKHIFATILLTLTVITAASTQIIPPPGWENSAASRKANESANYQAAIYGERKGDYEAALESYRLLRTLNPTRYTYLDGEIRCLLALERFDEAVSAVQSEIDLIPPDKANIHRRSDMIVRLGEVYLSAGDLDKAWEKWNYAIGIDGENIQIYRRISMELMQKRMVDEAIEILQTGDFKIGHNVLALDLARAHTAAMDYAGAVKYYLVYVDVQPRRLSSVENAIYALPGDKETVASVISVLRESNSRSAPELLSGYYFSLGRYEESLQVMIDMKAPPQEIINFALSLMGDGNYKLAMKAFSSLEQKYPGSRFSSAIDAGKAECLYNLGSYREAIELYNDLIVKFPRSSNSENAYFQLGMIYLKYFNDPDSASICFGELKRGYPLGKHAESVNIYLGQCAVLKGDLDEALEFYSEPIKTMRKNNPEPASQALLESGKVLLWKSEVDSALAVWGRLSRSFPASDAANDALNYILMFTAADEKLVKVYSDSWYASARRDFDSAQEGFIKVMNASRGSMIAGRAALDLAGIIMRETGDAKTAVDTLKSYIGTAQEAELLDEILMFMAQTSETVLGDILKAEEYYERLLIEAPDSPLVPIVRNRLDELSMEGEVLWKFKMK